MQNRYVCIHAHFYQPPRENPWLETIEVQDSASPFHDWNARISAECYRPNGFACILDDEGGVARLSNNYARISFNFGPTVLQWMEHSDETAYKAILDGDRQSRERFGGHGSAIAQVYNHIIMPLANRRDRETQVKWGLRDFEKRFGRRAEAMWLPETAVDTETLEILADHGMKFVILAPRQAKTARDTGQDWQDVMGEKIDPRQPYTINLPGGKSIAAFFYDGPISKAVAFEGVLNNGGQFSDRLMQGFDGEYTGPQLVHIATDGESYGHHHRHGEMALAYALDDIERNNKAEIVNYALYLEKFPPQRETEIYDNSSWSCVHGVGRWKEDCGCNSGMNPGWTQGWRQPLRQALDLLRDSLAEPYQRFMSQYTSDPWGMRDDYINVILDRSPDNMQAFLSRWLNNKTAPEPILKALEMQRNLMLIYTSCAWFFDEISGIETVQNMQYAARVIELARETVGFDPKLQFLEILEKAQSNIPEQMNGKEIYERFALRKSGDASRQLADKFYVRI